MKRTVAASRGRPGATSPGRTVPKPSSRSHTLTHTHAHARAANAASPPPVPSTTQAEAQQLIAALLKNQAVDDLQAWVVERHRALDARLRTLTHTLAHFEAVNPPQSGLRPEQTAEKDDLIDAALHESMRSSAGLLSVGEAAPSTSGLAFTDSHTHSHTHAHPDARVQTPLQAVADTLLPSTRGPQASSAAGDARADAGTLTASSPAFSSENGNMTHTHSRTHSLTHPHPLPTPPQQHLQPLATPPLPPPPPPSQGNAEACTITDQPLADSSVVAAVGARIDAAKALAPMGGQPHLGAPAMSQALKPVSSLQHVLAGIAQSIAAKPRAEVDAVFQALDCGNAGEVTPAECAEALLLLGHDMTTNEQQACAAEFTTTTHGKMRYGPFLDAVFSCPSTQSAPRPVTAFTTSAAAATSVAAKRSPSPSRTSTGHGTGPKRVPTQRQSRSSSSTLRPGALPSRAAAAGFGAATAPPLPATPATGTPAAPRAAPVAPPLEGVASHAAAEPASTSAAGVIEAIAVPDLESARSDAASVKSVVAEGQTKPRSQLRQTPSTIVAADMLRAQPMFVAVPTVIAMQGQRSSVNVLVPVDIVPEDQHDPAEATVTAENARLRKELASLDTSFIDELEELKSRLSHNRIPRSSTEEAAAASAHATTAAELHPAVPAPRLPAGSTESAPSGSRRSSRDQLSGADTRGSIWRTRSTEYGELVWRLAPSCPPRASAALERVPTLSVARALREAWDALAYTSGTRIEVCRTGGQPHTSRGDAGGDDRSEKAGADSSELQPAPPQFSDRRLQEPSVSSPPPEEERIATTRPSHWESPRRDAAEGTFKPLANEQLVQDPSAAQWRSAAGRITPRSVAEMLAEASEVRGLDEAAHPPVRPPLHAGVPMASVATGRRPATPSPELTKHAHVRKEDATSGSAPTVRTDAAASDVKAHDARQPTAPHSPTPQLAHIDSRGGRRGSEPTAVGAEQNIPVSNDRALQDTEVRAASASRRRRSNSVERDASHDASGTRAASPRPCDTGEVELAIIGTSILPRDGARARSSTGRSPSPPARAGPARATGSSAAAHTSGPTHATAPLISSALRRPDVDGAPAAAAVRPAERYPRAFVRPQQNMTATTIIDENESAPSHASSIVKHVAFAAARQAGMERASLPVGTHPVAVQGSPPKPESASRKAQPLPHGSAGLRHFPRATEDDLALRADIRRALLSKTADGGSPSAEDAQSALDPIAAELLTVALDRFAARSPAYVRRAHSRVPPPKLIEFVDCVRVLAGLGVHRPDPALATTFARLQLLQSGKVHVAGFVAFVCQPLPAQESPVAKAKASAATLATREPSDAKPALPASSAERLMSKQVSPALVSSTDGETHTEGHPSVASPGAASKRRSGSSGSSERLPSSSPSRISVAPVALPGVHALQLAAAAGPWKAIPGKHPNKPRFSSTWPTDLSRPDTNFWRSVNALEDAVMHEVRRRSTVLTAATDLLNASINSSSSSLVRETPGAFVLRRAFEFFDRRCIQSISLDDFHATLAELGYVDPPSRVHSLATADGVQHAASALETVDTGVGAASHVGEASMESSLDASPAPDVEERLAVGARKLVAAVFRRLHGEGDIGNASAAVASNAAAAALLGEDDAVVLSPVTYNLFTRWAAPLNTKLRRIRERIQDTFRSYATMGGGAKDYVRAFRRLRDGSSQRASPHATSSPRRPSSPDTSPRRRGDADRSVTPAQFKAVLGSVVRTLSDAEMQTLIDFYDMDGDGNVDFAEFLGIVQSDFQRAVLDLHDKPNDAPSPEQEAHWESAEDLRVSPPSPGSSDHGDSHAAPAANLITSM